MKLQQWYTEHAYTLHLDSTILNILPCLLPLTLCPAPWFLPEALERIQRGVRAATRDNAGEGVCVGTMQTAEERCGGGHLGSLVQLLFSCEREIRSLRDESLDAQANQGVSVWVKTPLGSTQTFGGYEAANRFNAAHPYMCCLLRTLPAMLCTFPASGAPLPNHCPLAIGSSRFYFHAVNNVLDSCC